MTTQPLTNRLPASALLKAGLAAVIAALLVNLLFRLILGILLSLDPNFLPFTYGAMPRLRSSSPHSASPSWPWSTE
jgi:hypothetical protein